MPEDGSPRPRPVRRLLLAISRAAALFILVTGIYGAATIALPRAPLLNRAIISLLIGVVIYEMMRRPRRILYVPSEGAVEARAADNSEEMLEAQHTIDRLRGEADGARNREAQAREQYERENENLQRAANRALEDIQRVRAANDELRGQLEAQKAEAQKHASALTQELEALRADRQRARREVEEAKQKAEVEKAAQRKTIDADSATKFKDVQRDLELTRSSAQQLLQSNEALKQQLDEERQRLHAELQRIIAESKSERDEMQAEARAVSARLEELLAQLERERKLSQELSATRAKLDEENASLRKARDAATVESRSLYESNRAASQREQELIQRVERLTKERGTNRQQLEAEWDAKLQKIVSELASDHENDLGEALAKREEARAETRSLQQQVVRLERDREAMRQQIETEWGAKLQKIVTELTTDHENDMGDAIAAREAARAEVRSLHPRVAELEQENAALKKQRASQPAPPVDEKAIRDKIDAEWSAKLQTIVSHLAADHEADVGKSIEEREAARAELRNLNIKMTSMQQKLDAERKAHESTQTRLREAESQIRSAPTQPMAALTFPVEPAAPQEELKARADVLEFAEQAQEALRRITSPGDVPVPAEQKPRILIVHHDPAIRSMWRDNLGKSGFDVQTAADGMEGLKAVKVAKPVVVIADVSMPKMSGSELCHLIKSDENTADVKVILLTGVYTNEVPVDSATKRYEADELLRKPVKLEAMKAALSSLLKAS